MTPKKRKDWATPKSRPHSMRHQADANASYLITTWLLWPLSPKMTISDRSCSLARKNDNGSTEVPGVIAKNNDESSYKKMDKEKIREQLRLANIAIPEEKIEKISAILDISGGTGSIHPLVNQQYVLRAYILATGISP